MDLRTREGREAEVLEMLREHGSFSVFWATENQKRAHAIDRLIATGRIRPGPKRPYPWCVYEIIGEGAVDERLGQGSAEPTPDEG